MIGKIITAVSTTGRPTLTTPTCSAVAAPLAF